MDSSLEELKKILTERLASSKKLQFGFTSEQAALRDGYETCLESTLDTIEGLQAKREKAAKRGSE
jgi:hypothetical protein